MAKRSVKRAEKVRRCPCCNQIRPVRAFSSHTKSGKRTNTISLYCLQCRRADPTLDATRRQWTWADAVVKHASMVVARAKEGDSLPDRITPEVVRALARLQGGKCALTGWELLLPDGLEHGETLSNCDTYTAGTPVLVRARDAGAWEPGNLLLICAAIRPAVLYAGGVAPLRLALGHSKDGVNVFTPEAITRAVATIKEKSDGKL